jgi:hypothetical protein
VVVFIADQDDAEKRDIGNELGRVTKETGLLGLVELTQWGQSEEKQRSEKSTNELLIKERRK